MKIIRDEILLCDDCHIAAVNGDVSGVSTQAQIDATESGLSRLGAHLVSSYDSESGRGVHEFTRLPCDCCGSKLAGARHEFAILGDSSSTHRLSRRSAPRVVKT
jgi:hypothetical protein